MGKEEFDMLSFDAINRIEDNKEKERYMKILKKHGKNYLYRRLKEDKKKNKYKVFYGLEFITIKQYVEILEKELQFEERDK